MVFFNISQSHYLRSLPKEVRTPRPNILQGVIHRPTLGPYVAVTFGDFVRFKATFGDFSKIGRENMAILGDFVRFKATLCDLRQLCTNLSN